MDPVYRFRGTVPDYFRREGNDWRTVKQIAAAASMTPNAVHAQFGRLRSDMTILNRRFTRYEYAYKLDDEVLWEILCTPPVHNKYQALAPVIEAMYLAHVPTARIAKELDLSVRVLSDHLYRKGLPELRKMIQNDKVAELKAQYLRQAA